MNVRICMNVRILTHSCMHTAIHTYMNYTHMYHTHPHVCTNTYTYAGVSRRDDYLWHTSEEKWRDSAFGYIQYANRDRDTDFKTSTDTGRQRQKETDRQREAEKSERVNRSARQRQRQRECVTHRGRSVYLCVYVYRVRNQSCKEYLCIYLYEVCE